MDACGAEYHCSQCGECLAHDHERAWRLSEGQEAVRAFYADWETFVNYGWNKTLPNTEEWFWYHRIPDQLSADCWRRAIPNV